MKLCCEKMYSIQDFSSFPNEENKKGKKTFCSFKRDKYIFAVCLFFRSSNCSRIARVRIGQQKCNTFDLYLVTTKRMLDNSRSDQSGSKDFLL